MTPLNILNGLDFTANSSPSSAGLFSVLVIQPHQTSFLVAEEIVEVFHRPGNLIVQEKKETSLRKMSESEMNRDLSKSIQIMIK